MTLFFFFFNCYIFFIQRNFYQLYLKKWVSTSLEQLGSIRDEIDILQHMAKMKETATSRGPQQQQQQQAPTQSKKVSSLCNMYYLIV